jgi:excisionase family DNA binding protein
VRRNGRCYWAESASSIGGKSPETEVFRARYGTCWLVVAQLICQIQPSCAVNKKSQATSISPSKISPPRGIGSGRIGRVDQSLLNTKSQVAVLVNHIPHGTSHEHIKTNLRSNSVLCYVGKIIIENTAGRASEAESGDRLLTKAQLANRLNVSTRTLENWMQQRLIPYLKPTRTVRFIWSDVEQALRRNCGVGYPPGTTTSSVR